jgi:hypothetical protein
MFLNYVLYACLLSPLLLAFAWSKSNRSPIEFSVLSYGFRSELLVFKMNSEAGDNCFVE